MYVCACVPCIHNPENAQKILQTQQKGNGHLGKLAIVPRYVNHKENGR